MFTPEEVETRALKRYHMQSEHALRVRAEHWSIPSARLTEYDDDRKLVTVANNGQVLATYRVRETPQGDFRLRDVAR